MKYKTYDLSYDFNQRKTIPDYRIEVNPLKEEDSFYEWNFGSMSTVNMSLAGFELSLQRNIQKYLVNYYLPSGILVVVSWVRSNENIKVILQSFSFFHFPKAGFLIPPELVPGRMTLLVTIFLVLINIFNNVTDKSPNVEGRGFTAISSNL